MWRSVRRFLKPRGILSRTEQTLILTKNAAIFSRTVNRDQKEEKLKSLKKGSFDGPTDIRKRYAILVKEPRESMEINASLGVKFRKGEL